MDTYDLLLSQIMDNPLLVDAVQQMATDVPNALNLITLDWKQRLENNVIYRDFCANSRNMFRAQKSTTDKYNFQNMKDSNFHVLVAAECRFPPENTRTKNKFYITALDVKPLYVIAKAMMNDLGSDLNISTHFKFEFCSCSILSCSYCKEYSAKFQQLGYPVDKVSQPCIADIRIFDGKVIANRFLCHMQDMCLSKFIALLEIKIDSRYDYTMGNEKWYRIGGKVQQMIAFQPSKLAASKTIHLGSLVQMEKTLQKEQFVLPEETHPVFFTLPEEEKLTEEEKSTELTDKFVENEVYDAIPTKKRRVEEEYTVEETQELLI